MVPFFSPLTPALIAVNGQGLGDSGRRAYTWAFSSKARLERKGGDSPAAVRRICMEISPPSYFSFFSLYKNIKKIKII
jgi:hypothetical protein